MSSVFGYGSLTADLGAARPATLRGWRRVWGVSTDNTRSIPGYKRYLRRDDGSQPPVFVTFLDIVEEPRAAVAGVVAAVSDETWDELDRRERNYERVEVTAGIDPPPEGPVYAYVGLAASRERCRRGRELGRAVVSRDYLLGVRAGFERLGIADDTDLEGLEVWDLERLSIPEEP